MTPAQQIQTTTTNPISAPIGKGGSRMWGYPLEFWESVFFWATGVAAVAGAIGVTAAFVAGIVGYQVTDRLVKESDRKISEANARGEEAKAEAAKANLELERLKAPRSLTAEQQIRMTEKLKSFRGTTFEIVTYPGLPEPAEFSAIISNLLVRTEWEIYLHPGRHSLLTMGSGVVVVVSRQASPKADEAGKALLESLISEGVAAKLGYGNLQVNPITIAIQIQVGTKH